MTNATTPPVPVADRAIDSAGILWALVEPSLNPYRSLWHCPSTGAGATWAHLCRAYGVRDTYNSLNHQDGAT